MLKLQYEVAPDEWRRTSPDILVYHPKGWEHKDGENEHFLVFFAPSGDMLATWNQAYYEGSDDHRVVIARSKDGGRTWSEPTVVAASPPDRQRHMCSWGFAIPSASGRIYCFYNQHTGIVDLAHSFTGEMRCKFSDDDGRTWMPATRIPMPRTNRDHPDDTVPPNWIVWQKPIRDGDGTWITGFTRWSSASAKLPLPRGDMWGWDARCEMIRFDNIDSGPDPEDLRLTWLPVDPDAITVDFPYHPGFSNAQEPSIVVLPDKRLFMVMRTMTGHVWYTVSDNGGVSWSPTEILRFKDGDRGISNPMTCSPIYSLEDGRFILLHANNDGTANGGVDPGDYMHNRRPAYIALGEYRPDAHQPIWFSQPKMIIDTDGVPVGPFDLTGLPAYSSFTERGGQRILWYPDRKYFLLGKYITDEWLSDMIVP